MTVLSRRAALASLAALAAAPARAAGQPLRIGLLRTISPAPLYIAMQRGYFAAEGLDAQFRFFEAAQPIAAAAVSGDIDVGITALTGGFFSLAGRGTLKVIGGALHEERGFPYTALLVSNAAYAAGLTTPKQLGGHSFGITQYGSSFHYMIGRIAEAEGFELKSMALRPLQTIANMVAAVRTGQIDATMAIASQARPVEAAGEGHIIGWAGDIVPYQITAVFAGDKVLASRQDAVAAFCRGYAKGVDEYRAAFLRPDGKGGFIHDGATDAALPAIEAYVYTGDPNAAAKIADNIGYYDAGGALDTTDVAAQLRWFIDQGMVRGPIEPADIIDTRFLPVLQKQ